MSKCKERLDMIMTEEGRVGGEESWSIKVGAVQKEFSFPRRDGKGTKEERT